MKKNQYLNAGDGDWNRLYFTGSIHGRRGREAKALEIERVSNPSKRR